MYHVEAEHDAPAKLLEDSYVHPYLSKLVYIRVSSKCKRSIWEFRRPCTIFHCVWEFRNVLLTTDCWHRYYTRFRLKKILYKTRQAPLHV